LRTRKRERLPFRLHLNSRQRKFDQQAEREWRGGYILTDGGDFVYVPQQLDITTVERLVHDPAPEPIIAKVCPPGGTVMDVGSNLGDWSLPMAKAVGTKGQVYAFEPVPFLADALTKTFQLNGFENGVVSHMALSDSIGEAAFTIAHSDGELLNVRCSSLTADIGKGVQTTVSTTTLDAFCANEKLDRLDFIKIDVENHEPAVIRGGAGAISRFQPAIVFEAGHWEEKREDRESIRDTLEPLGYRIAGILIEHGIVETNWDTYLAFEDPFMNEFYCNILCLPSRRER
jgi:FkbM family methyltransferase